MWGWPEIPDCKVTEIHYYVRLSPRTRDDDGGIGRIAKNGDMRSALLSPNINGDQDVFF